MSEKNNDAMLLRYAAMHTRCTRDIDTTCYSFKIEEPAVQELSKQIDKY